MASRCCAGCASSRYGELGAVEDREALHALVRAERERGLDFIRLSNVLSTLYPRGSEEKRLVDAMLMAASSR